MNTAHPASFPPGVCGSDGMTRSAMASTARPSGPVKKSHGPGFTGTGGLPAFGAHGRRSAMTAARADKPATNQIAVLVNKCRRLTPMTKTSEPGSLKLSDSSSFLLATRRPLFKEPTNQPQAVHILGDFAAKSIDV